MIFSGVLLSKEDSVVPIRKGVLVSNQGCDSIKSGCAAITSLELVDVGLTGSESVPLERARDSLQVRYGLNLPR